MSLPVGSIVTFLTVSEWSTKDDVLFTFCHSVGQKEAAKDEKLFQSCIFRSFFCLLPTWVGRSGVWCLAIKATKSRKETRIPQQFGQRWAFLFVLGAFDGRTQRDGFRRGRERGEQTARI